MTVLKRAWMPLLIVVVVAIAGFTVHRIRGFFGSAGVLVVPDAFANQAEPFEPKVVTYEVFGDPGSVADINYLDLETQPQRVSDASLPWELTLTTTNPAVFPNIVAQGNSNTIGCRITVDGEVEDEKISNGVNAQTFCLVKSA
jgi:Mycobacterium membrane protein